MSLQRGADIKGWEGVTRNLAANAEERSAWRTSTWWLFMVGLLTGMILLVLSQSDIPVIAKALMSGLTLLGTLVLVSSLYSTLVKGARIDAESEAIAKPALARKTAQAPAQPTVAPATPPAAESDPVPAAVTPVAEPEPAPEPEVAEPVAASETSRPEALAAARDGGDGDDLTLIKGVGPALKALCNKLGFWHFDQIAGWTDAEVAWVDENLEGFKGRVTRDEWVAQAKILAGGGETEFSARQ